MSLPSDNTSNSAQSSPRGDRLAESSVDEWTLVRNPRGKCQKNTESRIQKLVSELITPTLINQYEFYKQYHIAQQ